MPLIIHGLKKTLLVIVLGLLLACSDSDKQKTLLIEEGKRLFQQGDFQKAHEAFENAISVEPDNIGTQLNIADELEKLGDLQEAISLYQSVVNRDAKQLNARIKLGQILLLSGKVPEAEKLAKEALALESDNIEANVLLGGILSAQNNTDAAFVKIQQVLNKHPDAVPANLLLASLNAKIGKSDQAISILRNFIDKNSKEIAPRILLANIYMQIAATDSARELLASIIDMEPKELLHRQRMAMFFVSIKQLDKAEDVLRTAIKDFPDQERAKLLLIDFLAANRTPEVAIAELIPMVGQYPADYGLRFKLADLQLAQKHFNDVEDVLKDAIEMAGKDSQANKARLKLAQFYLTAGSRIEEARELVNKSLAWQPSNVDALILKANLAIIDHKASEAITGLRSIVSDHPDNVQALKLLSLAHQSNGDWLLAIENLQKVLDSVPRDESARIDLVNLLLKTGKAAIAEQQLNTLFKLHPNSKAGLETLSKIYLAQKQWEQARQVALQLQKHYTDDAIGYYLEGLSYQAEGKFDKSVTPLLVAVQKKPDAIEPLAKLVSSFLLLKQTENAFGMLDKVIKKYPEHFFAYNLLGSVYGNTNKLNEAVAAYQKAIEIKPDWPNSYRNLAAIKQQQKKGDEAIEILQEGVNKVKDNNGLVSDLVNIYHQRKDYGKAISLFEYVQSKEPYSLDAINNLVDYVAAYAKEGIQMERASQLMGPLLQSNNPDYIDSAAWLLYRQGNFEKSKQLLLKAQELDANNVISLYHLGKVHYKLGDRESAKQMLQKVIDKKADFDGLNDAKAILKDLDRK